MIEKYLVYATIFSLGIFLECIVSTIFFCMFFFSLRGRTGGFHTKTFFACYLGTVGIYVLLVKVVYPFMEKDMSVLYILLFISIVLIASIGTINHPNLDMTSLELVESKRSARLLLLIELLYILFCLYLRADVMWTIFPSLAIVLCGLLMFIAKILRQEV